MRKPLKPEITALTTVITTTQTISALVKMALPDGDYIIRRTIPVLSSASTVQQIVHSAPGSPIKLSSAAIEPVFVSDKFLREYTLARMLK